MIRFPFSVASPALKSSCIAIALIVSSLFLTALSVRAQDEPDGGKITINTTLVQLNVGVVDSQGHAVTNLSRNDFSVYEDNVLQPITSFEPTTTPFSLVLLLDLSGSTLTFRPTLKQAAYRFLDALQPEDRVAVNREADTLVAAGAVPDILLNNAGLASGLSAKVQDVKRVT